MARFLNHAHNVLPSILQLAQSLFTDGRTFIGEWYRGATAVLSSLAINNSPFDKS
jgi:hypothetical protein